MFDIENKFFSVKYDPHLLPSLLGVALIGVCRPSFECEVDGRLGEDLAAPGMKINKSNNPG